MGRVAGQKRPISLHEIVRLLERRMTQRDRAHVIRCGGVYLLTWQEFSVPVTMSIHQLAGNCAIVITQQT